MGLSKLKSSRIFALIGVFLSTCRITIQESRSEITQRIFSNYDSRLTPPTVNKKPTEVLVQIYVSSIDSIQELYMDYKMEVYLRQVWYDKRLMYNTTDGIEYLQYGSMNLTQLWHPDLFFSNEKAASFHNIVLPNRLWHIYPDGKVFFSVRLSLILSCPMALQKYPFDRQFCPVSIESYSHTVEELVFKWHGAAIAHSADLSVPHFEYVDFTQEEGSNSYAFGKNYTFIRAMIQLSRQHGYYITQIYVPSILIVIVSWLSFWLDVDAIPARISLGLLTVLTITTGSSAISPSLPRVSYIKAIDVWMAVCLFSVFAALIEFAIVNVIARVPLEHRMRVKENDADASDQPRQEKSGCGACGSYNLKTNNGRVKAELIDKICRVLFPLLFLLFNGIYWVFVFDLVTW